MITKCSIYVQKRDNKACIYVYYHFCWLALCDGKLGQDLEFRKMKTPTKEIGSGETIPATAVHCMTKEAFKGQTNYMS